MMSKMNTRCGQLAVLIALVALLGLAVPSSAQTTEAPEKTAAPEQAVTAEKSAEELPKAVDLLARHVEGTGGAEAQRAISSITLKGNLLIPAAGITAPMTVYGKAPNKALVTIAIPGMGDVAEGFDGEVAWSKDMASGPSIKAGKELEQTKLGADFYGDLSYDIRNKSWETVEATQFAGEAAYKVKLIDKLGDVSHDFFSKETGLKIGRSMTKESQMGPLNVTVTVSDYTKHGEVLVPMQVLQDLGAMQQTFKFDSVSFDAIEDSLFELPAEIKALLGTE